MSAQAISITDVVSESRSNSESTSEVASSAIKNLGIQESELVNQTPPQEADLLRHQRMLGKTLLYRYWEMGDLSDLEAAVKKFQEAVDLTPKGHLERAGCLQNLAVAFTNRYRRLGELNDLDAALEQNQEAVNLSPKGHPDRAAFLLHLGSSLTERYERLGDLSDLEAALQADQEALGLTPDTHPDRPKHLQSLALSFMDRYRRLGDINDLEAALKGAQEAVDLTPEGHPDRVDHLQSLAVCFRYRYQRSGDLNDLNAALQRKQEAVDLTPEGHPQRARHLQNLAVSFRDRYKRLGDLNDLEAAVQGKQEAVDLTPEGHLYRAGYLESLGVSLTDRYQRLGDLNDLDAAVQRKQESVDLTPEDHPDRAQRLQNLAVSLTYKYQKLGRQEDLEVIHSHYTDSFKEGTSNPEYAWDAALTWASFCEEFHLSSCLTAYTAAFHLLPEILWIGNSINVRHNAIHRLEIGEATSSATKTCINFSNLSLAVEIMEQGLGITFQQMLQLRTDLDGLAPDQANKLKILSSELYSGVSHNPRHVAIKRQDLLKDIRAQPGLEYFLLPKPYKTLCHASQGGPVVMLNSHQEHCDGIILLNPTSDPVHVPLPNVTIDQLKSQQKALRELLGRCNVRTRGESESTRLFGHRELFGLKPSEESFAELLTWLYVHVVAPVYQVLELHGFHNGRLWWLPTGAFTGLPLHASPPTNQFIHSYTTTLSSLLDGYAKKSSTTTKVGVVGVTHTGGGSNYLQGVEQEVKAILSIIKKSQAECLQGQQATVDAVKLQLQNYPWVHLACHGTQNLVEPTKSHLLLYGGNLELESIVQMPLSNAQFVFLAACQTAKGDTQLVNESFHLGGGFIAAGFRGAIGTMWSMNDQDGPLVAEIVYSHLFRDGRPPQASDAAEALQLAVKELKARKVPYERWITFIHMGI